MLPSEQCRLMNRCSGLSIAFANNLKYLVFRRSRPPGGGTLAGRVSASNHIKRERQAEVAGNLEPLSKRHGCSSIRRCGPRPPFCASLIFRDRRAVDFGARTFLSSWPCGSSAGGQQCPRPLGFERRKHSRNWAKTLSRRDIRK
jgi:hypothetical protein